MPMVMRWRSVKIIELPAAGTGALTLNGTAITSADLPKTVTATELTGGGLKYAPPANANGTGYASFKFKVNDGTADSASEYTITINVTAVNDPATGTPTISGTAQVGQILTASTGDIADADGVPSTFHLPVEAVRRRPDHLRGEHRHGLDDVHADRE